MKFSFAVVTRALLSFAALGPAMVPAAHAGPLTWSNPQGSVTLYDTGSLTTVLQSSATLDDVHVTDPPLNYLDATSIPAISRSDAMKDDSIFSTITQLTVSESETTGMPFTDGSIGFESSGTGIRSGSGEVTLYLLINVPSPAKIDLSGIRSTIVTSGSPASAFTLNLFQSDAAGGKFGNALLSYAGSYFDASGSYQSTSPYYLLEMAAAANATPSSLDSIDFSFALDLQPITAVPEPGSAALVLVAAVAGLALKKAHRRLG